MNAVRETASGLLLKPLPVLHRGRSHTTSSALHDIIYTGLLETWPNFRTEVLASYYSRTWRTESLCIQEGQPYRNRFDEENVLVADETGVQGRFDERIGQLMSVIAPNEGLDFVFGDSKSDPTKYNDAKVPDFAILDLTTHVTQAVGEIKTPWVSAHELERAIAALPNDEYLRGLLGQIAGYMLSRRVQHAVLTNYEESLFLRQITDNNGNWILQFSPVIRFDDICDSAHAATGQPAPQTPSLAGPTTRSRSGSASLANPRNLAALIRRSSDSVTLRQCFSHLASVSGRNTFNFGGPTKSSKVKAQRKKWTNHGRIKQLS